MTNIHKKLEVIANDILMNFFSMGEQTLLSPLEIELLNSINNQQIIPVFQPIVNSHMRIKGFEILSRWRKDDILLQPDQFLPYITSDYIWMSLTTYTLLESIDNINKNNGRFYFSINIPPKVAYNLVLPLLITTAVKKLHNPCWANCLILEFSESINFKKEDAIISNINEINKLGVRIFLDDCFSSTSLIYPIKLPRLGGYKLDKCIVDVFMNDFDSQALIKSLVYYCRLTNSICIAEGVDELSKFISLKRMGIVFFQGYLISKPMMKNEMYHYIHKKK
ncbi:EAL domain-containing protein [Enterobacter asburiae]|uniref:EAL domain-containing protein n=1 Tax=Enterobacter asburiae TaxID=61645 RepID=UPI00192C7D46|nr:EAL domain-containing protein [Enterobacter asburiae]MBL5841318.1 EAL domain-containing protein [Enterobacter asburiae]MBL5941711.1 EAL domain-containing protein [Enterobacter asburiae]MBL5963539.1 EAL domain-containing protein [Enterobacter asburiae]MBL5972179.1 EAL domain-containing protein [Enterobacter asburiae]